MSQNRGLHNAQLGSKSRDESFRNGESLLDISNLFNEFMMACRQGDLAKCQIMISSGVHINGKDPFDYTPLIIASLCGHYELVQLLLESGALAERDTFQGERCIHNALNNPIRNLLLQYDYSKSTDPLQPWASHIQSLVHRQTPKTSDISLLAGATSFDLHKFLLLLRSPYFLTKLKDSPGSLTWRLPDQIPVESVRHVLRYLYLGDPPKDFVDPKGVSTEAEILAGIDKISKYLCVDHIWDVLFTGFEDRRLARQKYQDEVNRAQSQIDAFVNDHIIPAKIVVAKDEVQNVKWNFNNLIFADIILRADEQEHPDDEAAMRDGDSDSIPIGPMPTHRPQGRAVLYPVHKAFLIRCPYFDVMFSSKFTESQPSQHLLITAVDCPPEALEVIIKYIYTDKFNCTLDTVLDVLYAADMLMFETLKTKAAAIISNLGSTPKGVWEGRTRNQGLENGEQEVEKEPVNIYDVIRAAWDLGVQRLETFAGRYLAYHLENYIDEEEFAALIKESADRVKDRQETDTIELLDDIRYFLSERFRMRFEYTGLDDILGDEEYMSGNENGESEDHVGEEEGSIMGEAVGTEADVMGGTMRTLDGQLVEDEFDSDALNYRILIQKIDKVLDQLELDA